VVQSPCDWNPVIAVLKTSLGRETQAAKKAQFKDDISIPLPTTIERNILLLLLHHNKHDTFHKERIANMASAISALGDFIKSIYELILSMFQTFFGLIETFLKLIINFFTSIVELFGDTTKGIFNVLGGVGSFILGRSLCSCAWFFPSELTLL
jgi:hypothetical protein